MEGTNIYDLNPEEVNQDYFWQFWDKCRRITSFYDLVRLDLYHYQGQWRAKGFADQEGKDILLEFRPSDTRKRTVYTKSQQGFYSRTDKEFVQLFQTLMRSLEHKGVLQARIRMWPHAILVIPIRSEDKHHKLYFRKEETYAY